MKTKQLLLTALLPCILATLIITTSATAQISTDPSTPDRVIGYSEYGGNYRVDYSSGRSDSGIITGKESDSIRVVAPDEGGGTGGVIYNVGGYKFFSPSVRD